VEPATAEEENKIGNFTYLSGRLPNYPSEFRVDLKIRNSRPSNHLLT